MKKITLEGISNVLSKDELKNITGGSSCTACGLKVDCPGGDCSASSRECCVTCEGITLCIE